MFLLSRKSVWRQTALLFLCLLVQTQLPCSEAAVAANCSAIESLGGACNADAGTIYLSTEESTLLTDLFPGDSEDWKDFHHLTFHAPVLPQLPQEDIFATLTSLKVLNLQLGHLWTLRPSLFESLGGLEDLSVVQIQHDPGTAMAPSLFQNLTNLKILEVEGPNIMMADGDAFSGLTELTNLTILGKSGQDKCTKINSDSTLQFGYLEKLQSLRMERVCFPSDSSGTLALKSVLPNLVTLDLKNLPGVLVHPDTFADRPELKVLDLDEIEISSISSDSLGGLGNLERARLFLKNELPVEILSGLENLQHLEVSGANELLNLTALTSLSALRMRSSALPDLSELTSLKFAHIVQSPDPLNITNESLERLHLEGGEVRFVKCLNLKELICNARVNVTDISDLKFTSLEVFTLSAALNISRPLNYLSRLKNLTKIKWSGIPELELGESEDMLEFNDLQELSMTGCNLNIFPEKLVQAAPYLEYLDLSSNLIPDIADEAFANSKYLTTLKLKDNGLKCLNGAALGGLESLRILDLSYNDLESLQLLNMPDLQELVLSNNHLTVLPETLFNWTQSLTRLDISRNQLSVSDSPKLFQTTPDLEYLDLSNNKLRQLPIELFANLTSLQDLNLAGNELKKLPPDLLFWNQNLIRLDMSHNHLVSTEEDSLPQLLQNTTMLEVLRMSFNLLSSVPTGFLDTVPNLKHLDLSGNPSLGNVNNIKSNCNDLNSTQFIGSLAGTTVPLPLLHCLQEMEVPKDYQCNCNNRTEKCSASACLDCGMSVGMYCEDCLENSSPGDDGCCHCDPGYDLGVDQSCTACPEGTYKSNANWTGCKKCPVDEYQHVIPRTECTKCPEGRATEGEGAKALSDCLCPKGQFQRFSQDEHCMELMTPHFCGGDISVDGIDATCVNASFPGVSNKTGSVEEYIVSLGHYEQIIKGEDVDDCENITVTVNVNFTKLTPSKAYPLRVRARTAFGTVAKEEIIVKTEDKECQFENGACLAGEYVLDGDCEVCPVGQFKALCNNQTSCELCPPGTFNNQTGSRIGSDCEYCRENTFNPHWGAESCQDSTADIPWVSRSENHTKEMWKVWEEEARAVPTALTISTDANSTKSSFQIALVYFLTVGCICAAAGLLVLFFRPLRPVVASVDLVFNRHLGLHETLDSSSGRLQFKQSSRRGFLTVCAVVFVLTSFVYLLHDYKISKTQEFRTLRPDNAYWTDSTPSLNRSGIRDLDLHVTLRLVDSNVFLANLTEDQGELDVNVSAVWQSISLSDSTPSTSTEGNLMWELNGLKDDSEFHDGEAQGMPFGSACEAVPCLDIQWASGLTRLSSQNEFVLQMESLPMYQLWARFVVFRLSVNSWKENRRDTVTHVGKWVESGYYNLNMAIARAYYVDEESDSPDRRGFEVSLTDSLQVKNKDSRDLKVVVGVQKPTYSWVFEEKVFITVPGLIASILAIGAATVALFRLLSVGIDQCRNKWGLDSRSVEDKNRRRRQTMMQEKLLQNAEDTDFPLNGETVVHSGILAQTTPVEVEVPEDDPHQFKPPLPQLLSEDIAMAPL